MRTVCTASLVAILFIGCGSNIETTRSADPEIMELGWVQRENVVGKEHPTFIENYDNTHVDENFVEMIKSLHDGIDFVVILGTWCSDSKREVPRFLKIADLTSIPSQRIRYYGVDRSKTSEDGITEKYAIERVPTFILLKNGEEVGRIVESPKNSIEEDLLTLLAEAQNK